MKISFLVTYYNQAEYVEQSLSSILTQNLPYPFEILVGDDGSSDDTCAKVQRFIEADNRIKLFVMPREQGVKYNSIKRVSACRLHLLSQAEGQYFCILDGDDWYCHADFARLGVEYLDQNPDVAVCAFNYQKVYTDHVEIPAHTLPQGILDQGKYLNCVYTHAGACVLRNFSQSDHFAIIRSAGYFDDNDITIANLHFGKFSFLPYTVYAYRQTANSTWNSMSALEQHLVNVFYYAIQLNYAPHYRTELTVRYFDSIKYVFGHKSNIDRDVPLEKMKSFQEEIISGSVFDTLVHWNKIVLSCKAGFFLLMLKTIVSSIYLQKQILKSVLRPIYKRIKK